MLVVSTFKITSACKTRLAKKSFPKNLAILLRALLSGGFDLKRISCYFVVVIGRCADHGIAAQNSNRMQSAALLALAGGAGYCWNFSSPATVLLLDESMSG